MNIAPQLLAFATDNEGCLAVDLPADESENGINTRP